MSANEVEADRGLKVTFQSPAFAANECGWIAGDPYSMQWLAARSLSQINTSTREQAIEH